MCTVNFSHVPPHPFSSTALCLPPEPSEGPPPSYFIIFYTWHTEVRISCLGAGEDLLTQAKAAHQWLHPWRNETPLPIATNCQQFPGKGWSLVPRPAPLSLMKCWPAQACTGILQPKRAQVFCRSARVQNSWEQWLCVSIKNPFTAHLPFLWLSHSLFPAFYDLPWALEGDDIAASFRAETPPTFILSALVSYGFLS